MQHAVLEPRERPPEEPPPERSKRRQILDGARRVFLSSGFDGASMGEIAKAAGVSKGTLYVYFENKEQLFEALTIEEKRGQAEALFRIEVDDTDVRGALRQVALNAMAMMSRPDHVAAVRMVIGATEKFPRFGQAYYAAGAEAGHAKLSAYLAAQVAAGRLTAADPAVAAHHLFDLCCAGVLRRLLFAVGGPQSEAERARIVDDALDVFFAAYGPR